LAALQAGRGLFSQLMGQWIPNNSGYKLAMDYRGGLVPKG